MSVPLRLAAFAAGLAVVGAAGAALGAATDATPPTGDGRSGAPLRLVAETTTLPAGTPATWRFRIVDGDGETVRAFEREQTKLVHLIVVGDDLDGFQHLHPTVAADGTQAVTLTLGRPGTYRAIADFVTGGKRHVVTTDLRVPGVAEPTPLPPDATVASAGDGYAVTLRRPATLAAGREHALAFAVTRDGRPVRDLQPYLGAYGHLVALRAGDLAYTHVHPLGADRAAGVITFAATFGSPGPQRLFLQFRAGGRVRTAAFTQTVTADHSPERTAPDAHHHP